MTRSIRYILFSTCMVVVIGGNLDAQNTRSEAGTADQSWADLKSLAAPRPPEPRGTKKTREEQAAEHAQQVVQASRAAEAARAFYTRNPSDPRADEARKIEVISGLRGVTSEDPEQEANAVARARAFRSDASKTAKDRFEVALAMDNQELGLKMKAGAVKDRGAERKRMVENWRAEFGDLPEIESYAVYIARHADPKTSSEMAGQVARSAMAGATEKREAKLIAERASLLGKNISLKLPLVDGGELDLTQQRGHVTLIVLWSPAKPESLQPLSVFRKPLPRGAKLVCIGLGGTMGDVMGVRHALPAVTSFVHVGMGTGANQVAAALKLQHAPYVYVLNPAGFVSDFGLLSDLPSLLTRAGVVAKKTS